MNQHTLLLVDDEPAQHRTIKRVLRGQSIDVIDAYSGEQALEKIAAQPIDLVLLDLMMPNIDGFAVLKILRRYDVTHSIPVCVFSGVTSLEKRRLAFDLGADEFIPKTFENSELLALINLLLPRDEKRIQHQNSKLKLFQSARQCQWQLDTPPDQLIDAWSKTGYSEEEIASFLVSVAQFKNKTSLAHTLRVSEYSKLLAGKLGYTDKYLTLISKAAALHDAGKLCLPETILRKQILSDSELLTATQYTSAGAAILEAFNSDLWNMARIIALTHREKFDGTGYPLKLAGNKIPIESRIVAIADIFDVMMMRLDKKLYSCKEDVFNNIRNLSETCFDPQLVELFLEDRNALLEIHQRHQNNGDYKRHLCCTLT